MNILLSNDDGVSSRGLQILYEELKKIGRVWVVAPLEEMSTTGHSLTLHKPLRISEIKKDFYGVSGTPADCINLAVQEVIGKKPDLVVSGINRGANLGQDVYYSGTISAAREATIQGIRSFAISLAVDYHHPPPEKKANYPTAAKVLSKIIKKTSKMSWDANTLFNVNVPDVSLSKVKGVRLAKQGFQKYSGSIVKRVDHRGKDYFWVGGKYMGFRKIRDSDCVAVSNGFASITPIRLDTTHHDLLNELEESCFFD